MEQQEVGQGTEALHGLGVAGGDRLLGQVARCHDQRRESSGHEEFVERRVRQHEPEEAVAGGHGWRQVGPGPGPQEHDRPGVLLQGAPLYRVQLAVALHRCSIGRHEGERFFRPPFPQAELVHRLLIAGVGHQVETAQSPDRQDLSFSQEADRLCNRICRIDPATVPGHKCQRRAADRAGVGLGMEPAVVRVVVLGAAIRAHRERRHGGVGPVVRDGFDDGVPGPAVGAVDERVTVAPVGRVQEFGPAIITQADVRGDQCGGSTILISQDDPENQVLPQGATPQLRCRLFGQGRGLDLQQVMEPGEGPLVPFYLKSNPGSIVPNETGQVAGGGGAVHERPEPDPLHDAPDPDLLPLNWGHSAFSFKSANGEGIV